MQHATAASNPVVVQDLACRHFQSKSAAVHAAYRLAKRLWRKQDTGGAASRRQSGSEDSKPAARTAHARVWFRNDAQQLRVLRNGLQCHRRIRHVLQRCGKAPVEAACESIRINWHSCAKHFCPSDSVRKLQPSEVCLEQCGAMHVIRPSPA